MSHVCGADPCLVTLLCCRPQGAVSQGMSQVPREPWTGLPRAVGGRGARFRFLEASTSLSVGQNLRLDNGGCSSWRGPRRPSCCWSHPKQVTRLSLVTSGEGTQAPQEAGEHMGMRCIPEHAEGGIHTSVSRLQWRRERNGGTPTGIFLAASDPKEQGHLQAALPELLSRGKVLAVLGSAAPPRLPDSSCSGGLIWCRASSEFKSHLILPARTKEKIPLFLLLAA